MIQKKSQLEAPASYGGYFAFDFSPDGKTIAGGTGIIFGDHEERFKQPWVLVLRAFEAFERGVSESAQHDQPTIFEKAETFKETTSASFLVKWRSTAAVPTFGVKCPRVGTLEYQTSSETCGEIA